MTSPRLQHAALWLCGLLVGLSVAGCLGGPAVTADDAKERALAAEGDDVTARLENASCVDGWGLTSYAGVERTATVTNRTADGVYVAVTQPYWYSTAREEADVGSEATYLVTADTVRRVDGTDVAPC